MTLTFFLFLPRADSSAGKRQRGFTQSEMVPGRSADRTITHSYLYSAHLIGRDTIDNLIIFLPETERVTLALADSERQVFLLTDLSMEFL